MGSAKGRIYVAHNMKGGFMSIMTDEMSKLGFGLMRLPQKDGVVDLERVCDMVDRYMAAGFHYFDTAYVYHGGKSEGVFKEAVVKRYPRESFTIATKLPAWEIHQASDVDRLFNEQLERTGAGYIDFYLLHSVEDGHNYEVYEKYDCFSWGLQKKKEGKIRHFGFSFHGTPELLTKILDDHPEVEFVQIQLNYLDWSHPVIQSGKLYDILHSRNIPIIVMEPVKGGSLASLPPELEGKFKALLPDASIASWALRFVGSLPGVTTILSGMSDESQMDDNLKTFSRFEALSKEEEDVIDDVRRIMLDAPLIGCTACRYCCDGCPVQINIPEVFKAVNADRQYHDTWRTKNYYRQVTSEGGKAKDCLSCGQCEGVCPQHLPIIELMRQASELLDD